MATPSKVSDIWPTNTPLTVHDMAWIADQRAIDNVKHAMLDRIAQADRLADQIRIAVKALKAETR